MGRAGSATDKRGSGCSESTPTVVLALMANASIAVTKAVAGILTGSAAMLAEAAHSVADTSTEGLLLAALRYSERPADRRHPFGYGKVRFFWSLIAAVSIFVTGAIFSVYEGVFKTVFYEDSAALVGLLLAFGGIGLHLLTGSALWDGLASLLIGLLLGGVAYLLGRANMRLVIGQQADERLVRAIHAQLAAQPEVDAVVDLLTMLTGTDKVLLCARVDFAESLSATELERACVRIDQELHADVTDLDEIFIEPVPRTDPALRARVINRYGSPLANVPTTP